MDGSCYIPNNPQYGLQLECQWTSGAPTPTALPSTPQHCPSGIIQGNDADLEALSGGGGSCWATSGHPHDPGNASDDMGSFSIPLDLDPLPQLFPFSPCTTVYKTENTCSPGGSGSVGGLKEKPVHDMADVLLSLKHAVVHPGQTGHEACYQHQGNPQGQPQQQMSYTVHPHQMLMSPTTYTYCDPSGYQTHVAGMSTGPGPPSGAGGTNGVPPPPMFPSMSVNVSMNMTYHPATAVGGYEQVQWATGPTPGQTSASPGYMQQTAGGGLLSPPYPPTGATYSFTADFRPPPATLPDGPLLTATSSFKPLLSATVRNARRVNYVGSTGKVTVGTEDDATGQRPNLCRICGKTYARPSTLKTHLRTHSGEKPYRCLDCNKSFSQAANLTAHVRTHSGEKPFRCPICDRRFSQSSSVTTHMRTHSGERPYRCRMCKKAFSDSSTLTKHLRIHSGEKPYQCKLCLLRFSQSGNLNRHMRVHGGSAAGATVLV